MAKMITAGIVFKIGDTVIPSCYSTPALGSTPEQIDVSSFDDKVRKSKLSGLQDQNDFNFSFWVDGNNFDTARAKDTEASNNYTLQFPNGTKYTWQGTQRTYMDSASVNDALKFVIACSVSGDFTISHEAVPSGT